MLSTIVRRIMTKSEAMDFIEAGYYICKHNDPTMCAGVFSVATGNFISILLDSPTYSIVKYDPERELYTKYKNFTSKEDLMKNFSSEEGYDAYYFIAELFCEVKKYIAEQITKTKEAPKMDDNAQNKVDTNPSPIPYIKGDSITTAGSISTTINNPAPQLPDELCTVNSAPAWGFSVEGKDIVAAIEKKVEMDNKKFNEDFDEVVYKFHDILYTYINTGKFKSHRKVKDERDIAEKEEYPIHYTFEVEFPSVFTQRDVTKPNIISNDKLMDALMSFLKDKGAISANYKGTPIPGSASKNVKTYKITVTY